MQRNTEYDVDEVEFVAQCRECGQMGAPGPNRAEFEGMRSMCCNADVKVFETPAVRRVQLSFRVTAGRAAALDKLAKHFGKTQAEILRLAMDEFVAEHPVPDGESS